MPLLNRRSSVLPYDEDLLAAGRVWPGQAQPGGRPRLLEACGNVHCRSGWLHLLRSRSGPVFEGAWNCSDPCTAQRVRTAVRRELEGRKAGAERHRHRVPLGLLMLEQGWINEKQLRSAVENQRAQGGGRIGQWLMVREGVAEELVTRALGLQWSCPVLPLHTHDAGALAPLLPRFFVDAFGALPLRVAASKVIYLGFEDHLDPVLALALERVSGQRVEIGIIAGSQFAPAHMRTLEAAFPPVELIEAASEHALVRALARRVEQVRPVESRLVRVHDCLWLRLWTKAQNGPIPEPAGVRDVICTLGFDLDVRSPRAIGCSGALPSGMGPSRDFHSA